MFHEKLRKKHGGKKIGVKKYTVFSRFKNIKFGIKYRVLKFTEIFEKICHQKNVSQKSLCDTLKNIGFHVKHVSANIF